VTCPPLPIPRFAIELFFGPDRVKSSVGLLLFLNANLFLTRLEEHDSVIQCCSLILFFFPFLLDFSLLFAGYVDSVPQATIDFLLFPSLLGGCRKHPVYPSTKYLGLLFLYLAYPPAILRFSCLFLLFFKTFFFLPPTARLQLLL